MVLLPGTQSSFLGPAQRLPSGQQSAQPTMPGRCSQTPSLKDQKLGMGLARVQPSVCHYPSAKTANKPGQVLRLSQTETEGTSVGRNAVSFSLQTVPWPPYCAWVWGASPSQPHPGSLPLQRTRPR